MANEENLKPIRDHTRAQELGRRGGKRSGQARRRKKEFRDVFSAILPMEISDALGEEVGLDFKRQPGGLTAAQAMAMAQVPPDLEKAVRNGGHIPWNRFAAQGVSAEQPVGLRLGEALLAVAQRQGDEVKVKTWLAE